MSTVGWDKVAVGATTLLALFMGWIFMLMVEQDRMFSKRVLIDAVDIENLKTRMDVLEKRVGTLEKEQWRESYYSTAGMCLMAGPIP